MIAGEQNYGITPYINVSVNKFNYNTVITPPLPANNR